MSTAYPPEPWHLTGRGLITTWRVPVGAVPALPPGTRPLPLGPGHTAAVTMLVDYRPGGDLSYRELLAGVLVRVGRRPALSVTDIWVDSEASLAGGRALWAVPKQLASFGPGRQTSVAADGRLLATVSEDAAGRLAAPVRVASRIAQERDGHALVSKVAASGRMRRTSLTWHVPARSPLAWLTAGRPLVSVAADPFSMTFG
ncbi:acetoacetate decarboxylase family protein [Aeromicrobium massiliense]|uniref:acetoacetate decarboxylase family protein n=1 Tax=Aeromicrobium massiliense TaxID=1464554 RepID=UPI000578404A|nr:acetoacetate decarboxylase family protein [Aeromicrobium massiliense]